MAIARLNIDTLARRKEDNISALREKEDRPLSQSNLIIDSMLSIEEESVRAAAIKEVRSTPMDKSSFKYLVLSEIKRIKRADMKGNAIGIIIVIVS
jgi:hypothetical protein